MKPTTRFFPGKPLRTRIRCWFGATVVAFTGCAGPGQKPSERPETDIGASHPSANIALSTPASRTETELAELTISPWRNESERSTFFPAGFRLMDQSGRPWGSHELAGKPFVTTFLYTRCENPNKCPLVARTLGKLQGLLRENSLGTSVHVVLVTYDPEYDSPARLQDFSTQHSLQADKNLWLIRPDPAEKKRFFESLNVAVNFNQRDVNAHRIELMLFDSRARFVRSYHSLIWDNTSVLTDLQRLAQEP